MQKLMLYCTDPVNSPRFKWQYFKTTLETPAAIYFMSVPLKKKNPAAETFYCCVLEIMCRASFAFDIPVAQPETTFTERVVTRFFYSTKSQPRCATPLCPVSNHSPVKWH